MLVTEYGNFDGNSWEDTCQKIFKRKYGDDNYQEMSASPGDYGIEGIIKSQGVVIQCYCPNDNYTNKELYEKQRDKITEDLKKLKKYESQIEARIGEQKISKWIFLTPIIHNNDLLKHATTKTVEIQSWNLEVLDDNVQVLVQDAAFYATEIRNIQVSLGEKVSFLDPEKKVLTKIDPQQLTDYEENIKRKNALRCKDEDGTLNTFKHQKLNDYTGDNWLNGDTMLKKIERDASDIYYKLEGCFAQFESEVEELCITWQGTANDLIEKIRAELSLRIKEVVPDLSDTDRYLLANTMTSRWIALCPLEIYE